MKQSRLATQSSYKFEKYQPTNSIQVPTGLLTRQVLKLYDQTKT